MSAVALAVETDRKMSQAKQCLLFSFTWKIGILEFYFDQWKVQIMNLMQHLTHTGTLKILSLKNYYYSSYAISKSPQKMFGKTIKAC